MPIGQMPTSVVDATVIAPETINKMRLVQCGWKALVVLVVSLASATLYAQTVDQVLAQSAADFRQQNYKHAIHLLEEQLKQSPSDRRLRMELGRAYLYDHDDERAMRIFRGLLREEPSNGLAKLELARALGYQQEYERSNRFYRELLNTNPNDEAASAGLVRNLIHQRRDTEARAELDRALSRHPESARLQDLKSRLESGGRENGSLEAKRSHLQGTETFFTDSASNRMWRSWQQLDTKIGYGFTSRLQMEERSLWVSGGPKANVISGIEDIRYRVNRFLLVDAGGGLVRFADSSHKALYRGELESHPWRRLRLIAGFSRLPVSPTVRASQFDLLREGWYGHANWNSSAWRLDAHWSHQHYSDHNLARREGAELIRWLGGPRLSIGGGYEFNHLRFSQNLLHGYFDPNTYQSHLGVGGVRLQYKKFRSEYLARVGGESISAAPYQKAWEISLRNSARLGNWDLGADYSYFHLAQNTGAFTAHMPHVFVAYSF